MLTTTEFDASSIDPTTAKFGPSEAIDADGDLDMVLHFKLQDTGITCGSTDATLIAETSGGANIEGTDSIVTSGC